jgi:hypothetical protein
MTAPEDVPALIAVARKKISDYEDAGEMGVPFSLALRLVAALVESDGRLVQVTAENAAMKEHRDAVDRLNWPREAQRLQADNAMLRAELHEMEKDCNFLASKRAAAQSSLAAALDRLVQVRALADELVEKAQIELGHYKELGDERCGGIGWESDSIARRLRAILDPADTKETL